MDFFRSVFSSQPDPPPGAEEGEEGEEAAEGRLQEDAEVEDDSWKQEEGESRSAWGGFSGLIKTLANRSESVIQTYRRDLEEFGSGVRKETEAIREAIKDLPSSLEAGASVAQVSLESVGQAIDDLGDSVWRGTTDIIAQGKEALLSVDSDGSGDAAYSPSGSSSHGGGGASRSYNRFEAKILGVQSDPATFSEEPEDAEDFGLWIAGFQLAEKAGEVGNLLAESKALEGNLARLVPHVVDYETFWSRYFYKVYKLKQAEDMRANIVKRVISRDEDEELSWEIDDEEIAGKDIKKEEKRDDARKREFVQSEVNISVQDKDIVDKRVSESPSATKSAESAAANASPAEAGECVSSDVKDEVTKLNTGEVATKMDEKTPGVKGEATESCKDSDVSVVSSQPSMQEEDDIGWDEIEDLGDNEEKKVGISTGTLDKIDLRKKLNVAEEEELIWDIEDDEPIKP